MLAWLKSLIVAGVACAALASPSAAQTMTVRLAKQPGVAYLPLMVMEKEGLFEKQAEKAGFDITTEWLRFTGGSAMNEALISGSLDIATGGIPPLLTIWSRTENNLKVKGIAGLSGHPQLLLTTNPNIKTLADFSASDKIAVPAVKVSNQAVMMQMAAAKELGEDKAMSIDPFTVSMGHPDALAAMLGGSDVNSHFSQSPFQDMALEDPKVRAVMNSWDIVGGPYPIAVAWATSQFSDDHPGLIGAFIAALQEAQAMIQADLDYAAATWIEADVKTFTPDQAKAILSNPDMRWDAAPQNTLTFLNHMNKVGLVERTTDDWRDVYFPEIGQMDGS